MNVLSDGLDPFSDEFYSLAIENNITVVNNIVTPKTTQTSFASQLQLIKNVRRVYNAFSPLIILISQYQNQPYFHSKFGTAIILTNVANNAFYNAADILVQNAIQMQMFGTDFIWVMDNTQFSLNATTGAPLTRVDGVIAQQEDLTVHLSDLSQKIIDMWTPKYTATFGINFNDTLPPIDSNNTQPPVSVDATLDKYFLDSLW